MEKCTPLKVVLLKNKDKFVVIENNPSVLYFYITSIMKKRNCGDNNSTPHFKFVNFEGLQHQCDKNVLIDD